MLYPIHTCKVNLKKIKPYWSGHRGSQLYFHITRYVLKEEGGTLFFAAQSESRISAPFFTSKSVVFVLLTGARSYIFTSPGIY